VTGLLTLLPPFVTAPIFMNAPLWIYVVGVILSIASFWLAALAVRAPGALSDRVPGDPAKPGHLPDLLQIRTVRGHGEQHAAPFERDA
jgi:hypothetical protein